MCLIRCFRMKQEAEELSWYVANITVSTTFPAPTSLQLESFSNEESARPPDASNVDKLSAPDGPGSDETALCAAAGRYRQFANATRGRGVHGKSSRVHQIQTPIKRRRCPPQRTARPGASSVQVLRPKMPWIRRRSETDVTPMIPTPVPAGEGLVPTAAEAKVD